MASTTLKGTASQNPDAPGEPDYWGHDTANPVPGTAKKTRDEREGTRSGQHDKSEGSGHHPAGEEEADTADTTSPRQQAAERPGSTRKRVIRAVIFDMDGVLIDTEPVWREVEIEAFGELGLHLTEDECKETMGLRIDEVVDLWYSRHPWRGPSRGEVARRIEDGVIAKVQAEGKPLAGALEVLHQLRQKGFPIAIASS